MLFTSFSGSLVSRIPGAVQADILEPDENGIIPEQARVITQVVILDADKKQIQCVVRPLQILRADGTWENIGGMK
ncbi:phage tail fiber C-terminal domain-containing protein [Escherichia albertii]|uniref:phage tail fiber C-terminal domain-containing protein n=1 Tax=Escherichia albertii TaxID=208962 RepID=UPI001F14CB4C|nr:phage tail fiber C-terminal domain-containing protein [Escherichia albertii]